MFSRIADWLITRAKRTPYTHLEGYMNRWWLIPYNRFGIAVRVHEILNSDSDRHLHDHPWSFVSVVLRGGYHEYTPLDCSSEEGKAHCLRHGMWKSRWRGPGSVAFRRASAWHRIEVVQGDAPTTLFISFKKSQSWGFNVEGKKVLARDYLGPDFIDTDYEGGSYD